MTGSKSALTLRLAAVFILSLSASGVSARTALETHVTALSSDIGPRNPAHYHNLERAAEYIKGKFTEYGYRIEEQVYIMEALPTKRPAFGNIIAVKEGKAKKDKIVIVCAHYDTYRDSPGADDNASGVAAVLEIASRLKDRSPAKTVKFITFTNEELEAIAEDKDVGSFRYAKRAREADENIDAVVCLDMLGYYSDEPESQKRPFLLSFIYPDKGDFIGAASDIASYDLLMASVREFERVSDFPLRYLVAPTFFLPQIMTSDNKSFWAFGYRSVWFTDTCIYRNPYQHTVKDTYDTLDYKRMNEAVDGIYNVVLKLAE